LRIVVNTSIIISALMKKRSVAYLVLTSLEHEYFIPAHALTEVLEHIDEIMEQSELTPLEVIERMLVILERITIVEEDEVKKRLGEAVKIMGNRDIKDAPFVAALMAIGADAVLSYDEDFSEVEKHGYKWLRPADLLRGSRRGSMAG